jgi:hypothetical protein
MDNGFKGSIILPDDLVLSHGLQKHPPNDAGYVISVGRVT